MAVRTYPSYQDTNLNAKGSLIIDFTKPSGIVSSSNLIQLMIVGIPKKRIYNNSNGLYSINIPTVSTNISVTIFSLTGLSEQSTLTLIEYTTDEQYGNNGIVQRYITGYTGSFINYTFVPSIGPNTYKYEYLVTSTITAP